MFKLQPGFQTFEYHTSLNNIYIKKQSCFHFSVYVYWSFSMTFFNLRMLRKIQKCIWKGFAVSFCCLVYWELDCVLELEYKPSYTFISIGDFTVCAICKSSNILTVSSESARIMCNPLQRLSSLLLEKNTKARSWKCTVSVFGIKLDCWGWKWGDMWKETWTWK